MFTRQEKSCSIEVGDVFAVQLIIIKNAVVLQYAHNQGGDCMQEQVRTKERGDCHMAVSKAVVPMLADEVAESFMRTLKGSKLQPYTEEQRRKTDEKIAEVISARKKK